ncbi:MAG TPA: hypothetical protein VG476_05265 [Acidimicrobiales bacterium]|nr:hypothetical protein [Acidimicrobiales bacterium]
MHDLAPHLSNRTLRSIAIPGSHDAGSYSFDQSNDDAITQSEDLTHQLNDGAREFDVRLEATKGSYYLVHGEVVSPWLRLSRVFKDISEWATNKPGSAGAGPGPRKQEIILLNLSVDGAVPTADCQLFAQQLGDALVTPRMLQARFGTTDPGQVTLGQLWSLPDSKGAARVIMDNSQCLDAADPFAGSWTPDPPFGKGNPQSYYANQCTAKGIEGESTDPPTQGVGVWPPVSSAVKSRSTDGAGLGPPTPFGPSMVGGVYTLFIQGTPNESWEQCSITPKKMLPDEKTVLAELVDQWRKDNSTKANLNVVSGDFFQETDLVRDVMAMDASWPTAS